MVEAKRLAVQVELNRKGLQLCQHAILDPLEIAILGVYSATLGVLHRDLALYGDPISFHDLEIGGELRRRERPSSLSPRHTWVGSRHRLPPDVTASSWRAPPSGILGGRRC